MNVTRRRLRQLGSKQACRYRYSTIGTKCAGEDGEEEEKRGEARGEERKWN